MNQIIKHSFEAVSLLTTSNGMLEVTVIPAINQPDWLIPSSLILSIDDYDQHVWTYLWAQQEVAVFHLTPRDHPMDKVIVLEGNTAVHRLALQTIGELQQMKVRISDVKDIDLPERYVDLVVNDNMDSDKADAKQPTSTDSKNTIASTTGKGFKEDVITSYMFQTVSIDDVIYLIPDLDKIAHQLVDLDS
ncbi:hypothetical protein [uncultured Psychrobacter sp.]|uniref:hypothetical protein n=1 Tax=uncultured Psychrobacter sp. TaxID=259303 RepID=UPI00345878DC